MWVQTRTDPTTLVNLDQASKVYTTGRNQREKPMVMATIGEKAVPLADCDSVEAAEGILEHIGAVMHTNLPMLDLRHI